MKRRSEKQKVVKGTSSAVLISVLIHVGLFLLAGTLVIFTVVKKKEIEFEPPKTVERPKMKLKKPRVKVKKSSKPKSTARIVSKSARAVMPDLALPEMSGMGDGLGVEVGGFDMMPALEDITLFGGAQSVGNDFVGTFYDFNRKTDGTKAIMSPPQCVNLLARFVKDGWRTSLLADYYRSPKKLYATTFAIPPVQSGMGPLAFGEPETQAYCYAAHYKGKLVYQDDIKFRFWGLGDDILVVRVDGEIVLNAPYPRNDGHVNDTKLVGQEWQSTSAKSRMYWLGCQLSVVGDWIELKAGEPLDMEVLIAETPGGLFQALLTVEVEGEEYEQNPERGGPRLPIFKTAEPTKDLYETIASGLWDGDAKILGGPVFSDYETAPGTNSLYGVTELGPTEVPVFTVESDIRGWTNSSGNTFTAKLVTRIGDHVLLETERGKQKKVPFSDFSPEDKLYVEMMSPPKFDINFTKSSSYVPPPKLSPYESRQRPMRLSDITFKTTLKQTSIGDYNHDLTIEYFAIGEEVDGDNYVLLERRESAFVPTPENRKSHTLSSETPVRLEVSAYRSASPMRGTKYGGYLVLVKDKRGVIIQYKASHEWLVDHVGKLKKLPVGKHFNKNGDRVCPPRPKADDRPYWVYRLPWLNRYVS